MDLKLDEMRTTIAGFGAAVVLLMAILSIVGTDEVLSALVMADTRTIVFVGVAALGWLLAWALALRTVLSVLGIPVSVRGAFLLLSGATFANNVTPFGQAGGEPFSALLVSRVTEAEYETGLAAVASVDALHFVPSISLALVGVGYYATTFTFGGKIVFAAASILGLAICVPVAASLGWRNRHRLESAIVSALMPVCRLVGRVVPRVTAPSRDVVRRRIQGFVGAIERISRDRRSLLFALAFSTLGWLLLSVSLWLSLYALGHVVPIAAVLFIIPLVSIAGVAPLPGGLGSIDAALILLIVPLGVDPVTAGAAAVIHRAATYWLPVLVGGGATAVLEADNTTHAPDG